METVVLIIGGNLGDRSTLIQQAKKMLQENIGGLFLSSSVFESLAWGSDSKNNYLNQVLVFRTGLAAERILAIGQQVETRLGRKRNEKWADRTMDVDILYIGDIILNKPDLLIPHPFIAQRRFVLEPLGEILPDFIHPVYNISNTQLLEKCGDMTEVYKYSEP